MFQEETGLMWTSLEPTHPHKASKAHTGHGMLNPAVKQVTLLKPLES